MAATFSNLTTANRAGWILSIEGCPYAFATAGVSSVAFTGTRSETQALGWTTSTVDWTILSGFLKDPSGWSERITPVEIDLEVSNMTFQIHDAVAPSGDAAGNNVMTWLGAGSRSLVFSTLNTSLPASGAPALSVVVDNGAVFGGGAQTIWIDREAIRISSRAGNTLTVDTSVAVGRGILGSKTRAHTIDSYTLNKPLVYTTFPWMSRRRVILWTGVVTSAGALQDPIPMWRGIIAQSPALSGDGMSWELACDHIWQTFGDVKLGIPTEACRTQGYTSISGRTGQLVPIAVGAQIDAAGTHYVLQRTVPASGYYPTLSAMCANVTSQINSQLSTLGLTAAANVVPTSSNMVRASLGSVSGGTNTILALHVPPGQMPLMLGVGTTGATATADMPEAAQLIEKSSDGARMYFATAAMLPTTWSINAPSASGFRNSVSLGNLVADAGEGRVLTFNPALTRIGGAVEPVDASTRSILGRLELPTGATSGVPGLVQTAGPNHWWLIGEVVWKLAIQITTTEWVHGFRYCVVGDTILAGTPQEIDTLASDWNWDRESRAYELTPGNLQGRHWRLDGSLSLRDMVTECVRFAGGCISIRYGSLALDAIRPPLRSESTDTNHTFTTASLAHGEKPKWKQLPDGIATSVDFTLETGTGKTRFVVNDPVATARFGSRRTVTLTARGIAIPGEIRSIGPRAVADHLFRRTLGIWSQQTETITISVSRSLMASVWLGETVSISEWLAPNQSRGRGWSARNAIVIGKEITPSALVLECLAWSEVNWSGFSPCGRASDITTNVVTFSAPGYAGSSDYAGSDETGYADSTIGTVASDGGTGRFQIGDRIELVERDNTAPRAPESRYITARNPAARTITLDANPNAAWQAIIAGGGIVDVRFDDYTTASLQTAQKTWAWIGDRATLVIGGTSDAVFRWMP